MRRAWIVGCVLLLAACSRKVTVSAVDLSVEYKGYVPQCVRVTVSDAEAPQEHTSSETLSRDKLASTDPNDDRTVRIAVYREESWSQRLLIEVTSFTDKCDGTVAETRKLEPVTLPAKGTEPRTIKLLAADGDSDGFFARVDDSAIPLATDCNDQNIKVFPGASAVCDGTGSLGVDFNCDGKSDCNGSTCSSDTQCGSGFCVDGVCCNNACNSPPTCRGTGVCNAAGNVGTCTYPVTPNVNCSDGNGCTLNDKCDVNGVCVAGSAKTCNTAPSQCHGSAGTCKPLTGACEYPPLPSTQSCNDNNNCTTTDRCNGSGTCAGTPKVCNTAPNDQCYASSGTCNATSGSCEYQPLPNTQPCNDNNKCTDTDKCNGSGTCAGVAKVCNSAPSQCQSNNGSCNSGTGACDYPALSNTTSCNDGKDCTSPDKCDGLGACASVMSCTPPNQCQMASDTACYDTGTCVFEVNTAQVGKVCTEGGRKGTCSPEGTCLRFHYSVTPNFNPETIADGRTLNDVIVACAATLDTSGATPTWSDSGCGFTKPTPVVLGSMVVVPVRNLVVNAPLRLVGTRSVIFAVYGNATLNDEILANSVRAEALGGAGAGVGCTGRTGSNGTENGGDGGGGGGGGLATTGGRGGDNDNNDGVTGTGGGAMAAGFSPLGGGCAGGDGGATGGVSAGKGGAGGGSVQISVAGTLTVKSVVSVSGAAGKGGGAAPGKTAGGGGGGSGGLLVLEADALIIDASAKLTANGGAGGEGGSDAGGVRTPGNDGTDASLTGSSPASGGTGASNGGGDGGAGAAGSATPGNGSRGTSTGSNQAAGGGGGGAAGRILLRGVTSCSTISPDSVISPAYDKTGGQCAAPALR
jgi:hypothetical protein